MGNKHMVERAERLAQLEQYRMVENDFVMVDPENEDRRIAEKPKGLNRQIEEGVYNIKPEDYNEVGELKVGGEDTQKMENSNEAANAIKQASQENERLINHDDVIEEKL